MGSHSKERVKWSHMDTHTHPRMEVCVCVHEWTRCAQQASEDKLLQSLPEVLAATLMASCGFCLNNFLSFVFLHASSVPWNIPQENCKWKITIFTLLEIVHISPPRYMTLFGPKCDRTTQRGSQSERKKSSQPDLGPDFDWTNLSHESDSVECGAEHFVMDWSKQSIK